MKGNKERKLKELNKGNRKLKSRLREEYDRRKGEKQRNTNIYDGKFTETNTRNGPSREPLVVCVSLVGSRMLKS